MFRGYYTVCRSCIIPNRILKCGNDGSLILKRFASHDRDYFARQSRMIKKFMTGSNRTRKRWFNVDQPVSKSLDEFSFMSSTKRMHKVDKPVQTKPIRRVEVLNTVFMEYLTGMMATGDVATQIVGLGIEVTRVKISNDFSCVNVYWGAKGSESDEMVEEILQKSAYQLRNECSKLRVMGVVPPIRFVKDKTHSKVMEVETLLSKCDFGDDFVPTASASLFNQVKPLQPLGLGTEMTIKVKIEEGNNNMHSSGTLGDYMDSSIENVQLHFAEDTEMRRDILGLDQGIIMETIVKRMKKKKEMLDIKQMYSDSSNGSLQARESDENSIELLTPAEMSKEVQEERKRVTDFTKYLKERSVLKSKAIYGISSSAKEREFIESESELQYEKSQYYDEKEDIEENESVDYEAELEQTFDEYLKSKNGNK